MAIVKMTILQTGALMADGSRYHSFDRIASEAANVMRVYGLAAELFRYLVQNPEADVKQAFISTFDEIPEIKVKTKKSRSYSILGVYVHEEDK